MSAPRKFDHDEARRRVAAGESRASVARSMGVTSNAVARAVNPAVRRRMDHATRLYYLAACDECGGPCLSNRHPSKRLHGANDGRQLCRDCRRRFWKRSRLRFTDGGLLVEVRCLSCQRWLNPDDFPRGEQFRDLREGGIHNACRECQTRMRREYREKRKVPCSHGCGTMVLHERHDPSKPPECRRCAMRRIHAKTAVSA